ncbi:MAG: hypothetical protein AABX70_02895 [Nanoarchaeota archaeon]
MNSKALVDIGTTEWIIATLVILVSLSLYATQSAESKQIRFEYHEQDTQELIHQRGLFTLLRTPVTLSGHEVTVAELLAYQEIDLDYATQLNSVLGRYVSGTHLILTSGSQIIYEYGSINTDAKLMRYETQIPSFINKKLVVTLEKERVS